ncbi:MAG: hypothetical protein CENE_01259 [Candidatus Celerinatantimonas neptuna]|nr:MAG: hypothetical protein CENE_01259 [Candidatus Celerinatantimonas neptuna]
MKPMMRPLYTMLQQKFDGTCECSQLLTLTPVQLSDHFNNPVQVLDQLAHELKVDSVSLQQYFGQYLFLNIVTQHPEYLGQSTSSFELFFDPNTPLLLEIAKPYQDKTPPRFTVLQCQPNQMVLDYKSSLPFAHVCHGFLKTCGLYFGETLSIHQQLIDGALNHVHFTLTKMQSHESK